MIQSIDSTLDTDIYQNTTIHTQTPSTRRRQNRIIGILRRCLYYLFSAISLLMILLVPLLLMYQGLYHVDDCKSNPMLPVFLLVSGMIIFSCVISLLSIYLTTATKCGRRQFRFRRLHECPSVPQEAPMPASSNPAGEATPAEGWVDSMRSSLTTKKNPKMTACFALYLALFVSWTIYGSINIFSLSVLRKVRTTDDAEGFPIHRPTIAPLFRPSPSSTLIRHRRPPIQPIHNVILSSSATKTDVENNHRQNEHFKMTHNFTLYNNSTQDFPLGGNQTTPAVSSSRFHSQQGSATRPSDTGDHSENVKFKWVDCNRSLHASAIEWLTLVYFIGFLLTCTACFKLCDQFCWGAEVLGIGQRGRRHRRYPTAASAPKYSFINIQQPSSANPY